MASSQELSDFLRAVERRAFKQTVYAVRDDHAALDIVQDAMLKLAEKYADKPAAEYPMLFQRIFAKYDARLLAQAKSTQPLDNLTFQLWRGSKWRRRSRPARHY